MTCVCCLSSSLCFSLYVICSSPLHVLVDSLQLANIPPVQTQNWAQYTRHGLTSATQRRITTSLDLMDKILLTQLSLQLVFSITKRRATRSGSSQAVLHGLITGRETEGFHPTTTFLWGSCQHPCLPNHHPGNIREQWEGSDQFTLSSETHLMALTVQASLRDGQAKTSASRWTDRAYSIHVW